jgi:hypothetical protein
VVCAAGGVEMLGLLAVHSVLNGIDLIGEEALRYQVRQVGRV